MVLYTMIIKFIKKLFKHNKEQFIRLPNPAEPVFEKKKILTDLEINRQIRKSQQTGKEVYSVHETEDIKIRLYIKAK